MTYEEALQAALKVRDSQPEMVFHARYLRQIIEALVSGTPEGFSASWIAQKHGSGNKPAAR